MKLKGLIMEILHEALWGKRFKLNTIEKNGIHRSYAGMATANIKPGELPYRISWFYGQHAAGHIDLTWEEVNFIIDKCYFPPEIIKRAEKKWGADAVAKSYKLEFPAKKSLTV